VTARRSELRILILSFPLSGLVTTQLGPLLPVFTSRWSLTDTQAGQLFLAQFLSSTAGALCSGRMIAKAGAARLIGLCYVAMAIAVLALGWASRPVGMLAVAGYGFALGASIPTVNLLGGQRSGEAARSLAKSPARSAAAEVQHAVARLNLLNVAWCAGAVLGPPAIVFLLGTGGLLVVLGSVSSLCGLAGAACLLRLPHGPAGAASADRGAIGRVGLAAAIAAAFFLFLYVGVENGLSGWLLLFAERAIGVGAPTAAAAVSAFWASILAARLAAASAAGRARPHRWILAGLTTAFAGIGALIFGRSAGTLLAGAAVAGLGLGPVFPTAVALFQDRAGTASARLIGLVFAAAGCGGGALPWLVGAISSGCGNLRVGMAATLAATAGMIMLLCRL
jgi:fucose permease